MAGPFIVTLASLAEGVNHLRLEGSAAEADIQTENAEVMGPVVVEGDFVRTDTHVEVQAQVRTGVRQNCGRCLAIVEQAIASPLRLFCEKQGKREEQRKTTGGDHEGLLYYDGRTLDLREEVRQVVLLEISWHPLCKPDCQGLCPQCGADMNLRDCGCPRRPSPSPWDRLRGLIEAKDRTSDTSQEKE
jgi:uncharacterized protein